MAFVYKAYFAQKPSIAYIGGTKNLKDRKYNHILNLKKNKHHCFEFQNDFNIYGLESLIFEVIEECNCEIVFERETYYIELYGKENLYNILQSGGTFGDALTWHPKRSEIVEKIKKAVLIRNKNRTPEEKEKISENLRGNKNPNWKGGIVEIKTTCKCGNKKVTNAKECSKCRDRTGVNNPFYGKKHSDETIKRMNANRKKIQPKNSKKVVVNGVVYNSITDASKVLGCTISTVINRIAAKREGYSYLQ